MKAYIHPNLDGRRAAMVAARTLVEAARKLGTSVRDLRVMGWRYARNEELDQACADPDWVFTRPVGEIGGAWLKWRRPKPKGA
jgi:hypothetical protein